MLTYGRQPRSPVDTWCSGMELGERNSHGEYLHALRNRQAELNAIASENIALTLGSAKEYRNKGRFKSEIYKGDQVMLRNDARHDSLNP